MKKFQTFTDILMILAAAVLAGIGLHVFVNAAHFAPSGIDGVAMMVQELFEINMGYVTLAFNIPLLIVAWFFINKKYVLYTALYSFSSSAVLILMESFDFYQYIPGNNLWISVFASGIVLGLRTAIMIKCGGSSGGVDIIACIIQRRRPYLNIENLISLFCYIIIGLSFFVYGNLESVLMSVGQMLIFNMAMNAMLKTTRNAVEVRIITSRPDDFRTDILENLKHGATVLDCKGMFTGDEKKTIVTIINIRQMNELIKLARKYPDSFMYFSEVSGVWGNFRWNKSDVAK